MTFAEQGDEGIFDGFLLADDGFADILLKGEDHSAGIDHGNLQDNEELRIKNALWKQT